MSDIIKIGLDIGSSKVTAIVGKLNGDKLEIISFGSSNSSLGVTKGVVKNINKTTEAIAAAVKAADELSPVNILEVISNIGGTGILSLESLGNLMLDGSGSQIQIKDTEKLTANMYNNRVQPGNAIIQVIPQEYLVDDDPDGIYDTIGVPGFKLEANFLTITSPTHAIENIEKSIINNETGINEVERKLLSPIAASISVLTADEKQAGVALIDIGAGTTDIIIIQKNIIRFLTVLPFGGNNVTDDIQQGCNVLTEQAEQLKIRFGGAISEELSDIEVVSVPGIGNRPPKNIPIKNIGIICEERLKEIAQIAWAQITKSGYGNKLSAGIVLVGGTAQMPDIDTLFKKVTKKDIRIGHPNIDLAGNNFENLDNPTYATAIGLLWAGFKSFDSRDVNNKTFLASSQPIPTPSAVNNQPKIVEKKKPAKPKDDKGQTSLFDMFKGFLKDDVGDKDKY
jgi:cell division protein FtsA